MPRVIHFELVADNADEMSQFYESIFGWKVQKWEGPIDYWFLMTGNSEELGIDGAFGLRQSEDDIVINTIDVDDAKEVAKKIEENGGKIVRPVSTVPGVGWLVYFKDTEGNLWGAMQNDPKAK